MRIETLTVGLFQVNVFLLQDEATGAWAMVDTSETADVVDEVRERLQGQELSTILLTHGHLDHAGALLPL
ncbi:MAG: MBL fold metallo-hydrolase, partial [Myxococcota bacterium]